MIKNVICSSDRSKLAGVPLNLREDDDAMAWIQGLHKGVLSLEYVSTSLSHEASYCLDLADHDDHSLMTKLLDRLYRCVAGHASATCSLAAAVRFL